MWSFRDIDFDFSVEQVNVEAAIDSDAVGGWVEDVTNDFPIAKRMIGNKLTHSPAHFVSQQYQELPSRVGEDLIVSVSFHLCLVPYLESFPGIVDGGDKLVHVWVSVHVSPQNLTVLRVIAACKILLSAIVDDGNTYGC